VLAFSLSTVESQPRGPDLFLAVLRGLALGFSFRLKSRRRGSLRFAVQLAFFGRQIRSRVSPRAEGWSMSLVAWKILRRLPKPLLLVAVIFVLAAAARA